MRGGLSKDGGSKGTEVETRRRGGGGNMPSSTGFRHKTLQRPSNIVEEESYRRGKTHDEGEHYL